MKKIKYEQSSLSKQVFLILLTVYMILRLIIILQIKLYKIPNYYNTIHFPITVGLYIVAIAILASLLSSYKLCYSIYDSLEISYINQLINLKKTVQFKDVHYVRFDLLGTYFYSSKTSYFDGEKELLKIPYFRFGRIDPVNINNLYTTLLNIKEIHVDKTYKILPGFGPRWKIISYIYVLLSVVVFMNFAQPIKVIILLYLNH